MTEFSFLGEHTLDGFLLLYWISCCKNISLSIMPVLFLAARVPLLCAAWGQAKLPFILTLQPQDALLLL